MNKELYNELYKLENKNKQELLEEIKNSGYLELEGSFKQLKWANDIRNKFIKEFEELKEQSNKDKDLKILKNYFDVEHKIENIDLDILEKTFNEILETKTQATYYIDNRNLKITDLIAKEMKY